MSQRTTFCLFVSYVALAVLELTLWTRLASGSEVRLPLPPFQVLGLKACTSTAQRGLVLNRTFLSHKHKVLKLSGQFHLDPNTLVS